ncbi:hypothetical protein N7535_007764 [Penicillium sp. DV-2018c]|nr:hypothetical protein N7461_003798 [Penicillium sp. DV-2018c]KAJ5566126.1 hypothetical protein N7535_007764 [Penicillium sp. DV-2018c]
MMTSNNPGSEMEILGCDLTGLSLDAGDSNTITDLVKQTHLAGSPTSNSNSKKGLGKLPRRASDSDAETDLVDKTHHASSNRGDSDSNKDLGNLPGHTDGSSDTVADSGNGERLVLYISDSDTETDLLDETHHTGSSRACGSDNRTNADNTAIRSSTRAGDNDTNAQRVLRLTEGPGAPYVVDIPLESDNLETAAKKMETIAEIIVAGGRLDIRIRPRKIVHMQWARQHARERMRGEELSHFNAWVERRLSIAPFDWSNELPFNEEAGEAFRKYAQAMDLIWEHQGATPGNVAWCIHKQPHIFPIIKAIAKMQTASDHFWRFGLDVELRGRSKRAKREYETMWIVHEAGEKQLIRARGLQNHHTTTISLALAVVRNHAEELKHPPRWQKDRVHLDEQVDRTLPGWDYV